MRNLWWRQFRYGHGLCGNVNYVTSRWRIATTNRNEHYLRPCRGHLVDRRSHSAARECPPKEAEIATVGGDAGDGAVCRRRVLSFPQLQSRSNLEIEVGYSKFRFRENGTRLRYATEVGSIPDVPTGYYYLGTDFPHGDGQPGGECRDYQWRRSTTYHEDDYRTLMDELKSVGRLPIGPRVPANGTVGLYIQFGHTSQGALSTTSSTAQEKTDLQP